MANLSNPTAMDRALTWLSRAATSRLIAAGGFLLLASLSAVIVLCRLAGVFSTEFSRVGYSASIIGAGFVCCTLKVIAEWPPHRLDRRSATVFGAMISLPLLLLTVSLLPISGMFGPIVGGLLWTSLVSWFCVSTQSMVILRTWAADIVWPEVERFLFPPTLVAEPIAHPIAPLSVDVRVHDDSAGEVISELQRRLTSTGEILEGQLVATFAEGTRQTVLHIPFTPPFAVAPHIDCEIADGSEVRIKIGAAYPYGARLELKRSGSDLPEQQVRLEVYAEAGDCTSEAA